jgi:DNA mismatch endonuclease (patch repair protein)
MAAKFVPASPSASSAAVRAVMQGNRAEGTSPEVAVRSELHKRGYRFRKHVQPLSTLRCSADIVFTREQVAVFIDGCFWHGCPDHGHRPTTNSSYWNAKLQRNIDRDRRNNQELARAGWLVLRAWEHESVPDVIQRISTALAMRRSAGT